MPSLERRLGIFSVITISISSMIGSGIFVLPGLGFQITGPSLFIAFFLSALCILPAAISKAELATAMPTSGGTYVYLERTFGPLVGTASGLGLFLSILLKASFSLVGIGAYFTVFSTLPLQPVILSFLVVIILLNIFGTGKVSTLLTAILFLTLISLFGLCLFAIPYWRIENLTPLFPHGVEGLTKATALVFVSFAGVTKIAAIAEEVKSPEKNLPRGIILSLIIVTFIYCSVSFVLAGIYNADAIAGELKIIHRLGADVGGAAVGTFMAVIASLTMANTANAGILAGSRFPFAMSRDKLIPAFIGKLHKKYLTPIVSILISGVIIAIVLSIFDVAKIAKLASAFMILIYMLENLAVIVLRESRAQWYKPGYKSAFYPFLQILGILSGGALLFTMGQLAFFAILSIAIPGVIIFLFYSKNKTERKGVIGIRGRRHDLLETSVSTGEGSFCRFDLDGDAEVVVSLFGRERSPEMLTEMAIAIAETKPVEVSTIIELPEQTDLHDVIEEPVELKSLRRRIMAMAQEKGATLTFDPVMSHDVQKTVFEISQNLHCRWLLIEWAGKRRGSFTFHNPVGWLKSHLECNLATFRDAGIRYIRSIMVLIHDDKNDSLVLKKAEHLSRVFSSRVTLQRYVSDLEQVSIEERKLTEFGKEFTRMPKIKIITGSDEIKSILKETCEYDLLILGSSDHSFTNSIFGTYDDKLIARASCSVLAIHKSSV